MGNNTIGSAAIDTFPSDAVITSLFMEHEVDNLSGERNEANLHEAEEDDPFSFSESKSNSCVSSGPTTSVLALPGEVTEGGGDDRKRRDQEMGRGASMYTIYSETDSNLDDSRVLSNKFSVPINSPTMKSTTVNSGNRSKSSTGMEKDKPNKTDFSSGKTNKQLPTCLYHLVYTV